MVGGGPFSLEPGQWADDTSMALALAESLLEKGDLDERDLMGRFVQWWQKGSYSCTGRCFDIGNTTRTALERWLRTNDPISGVKRLPNLTPDWRPILTPLSDGLGR